MLIPPVVAVVTMVGRPWYPVSDLAIIDLQVRDVWTVHTPLTGLWSRPGWSHPGPLSYWLIGVFSGLTGQAAWATRVGGALLGGVAVGSLAWITWRRGLRLMLAAATVTGFVYLATGPWIFRQPWNLHIPLPFFVLFLFLVVIVAEGGTRHLIMLALVASLIVQTHLGYALIVAVGLAWAVGWVILDARRARRLPDRWRSTLAISIGASVVVWIPPLVDQLVNQPGNLEKIAVYFLNGEYARVGLAKAAGIFASEYRFVPPWLGGPDRQTPFVGFAQTTTLAWLLVPAALLVLGLLAARSTGSRADLRRLGLAALMAIVAVVAISRADEPRAYTFQWRVVIAAFLVVASLWSIWSAIEPRLPRAANVLAAYGVLLVVTIGAVVPNFAVTSITRGPPEVRETTLRRVMAVLRAHGTGTGRRISVVPYGGGLHSLLDGLVNELDRDGVDVRVGTSLGRLYGTHRVGRRDDADETWYVTEKGSMIPELLALPGARVLVTTSPLSRAEDAELDRLQSRLRSQLGSAGRPDLAEQVDQDLIAYFTAGVPGVDPELARAVAALNRKVARRGGCRCAIVAVPGGRAAATRPTTAQR